MLYFLPKTRTRPADPLPKIRNEQERKKPVLRFDHDGNVNRAISVIQYIFTYLLYSLQTLPVPELPYGRVKLLLC